jgi:hypothetical protein
VAAQPVAVALLQQRIALQNFASSTFESASISVRKMRSQNLTKL